jgi:inositol-pentakisphosphate 2-kinase
LDIRQNVSEWNLVLDMLYSTLIQTPILSIVSQYQQTLDAFDIEGLVKLWESVHPLDEIGKGEEEPSLDEWATFAEELRNAMDSLDAAAPFDAQHLRHHLLAYALSATFKDCSIIISFSSRENLSEDGNQLPRVSVIDLDIKPLSRLGSWKELDKRIVDTYAKLPINRRKQCRAT